jgi:hypothetical protein
MAGPLGALNYLPFAGGLAGGGGTAATTAAGGAGLAALGPWMLGATALSTVGGLIGGSQQANSQAQQTQLQGLFTKLAPINQSINYAGQELMASMAPYLGAQAAQTNLIGQSVYDMFTGARSKESQMAGVQTAMAYGTGQALTDVTKTAAMGKVATGLKGMETQAGLVEKGADALGLQYTNLAKGLTDVGTNAANTRNAQVLAQTQANLDIGKGLSLLKGQGELHFAKQRSDRAAALGAGGFA